MQNGSNCHILQPWVIRSSKQSFEVFIIRINYNIIFISNKRVSSLIVLRGQIYNNCFMHISSYCVGLKWIKWQWYVSVLCEMVQIPKLWMLCTLE